MGDNFLDVLGAPVPLKEFIENKITLGTWETSSYG